MSGHGQGQSGQTMVEYAIVLGLLTVLLMTVALVATDTLGEAIHSVLDAAANAL